MRKAPAALLLTICTGCLLPRSTPLGSAAFSRGHWSTRFGAAGHQLTGESIMGFTALATYGFTQVFGLNARAWWSEAGVPDSSAYYREFETGCDLVLRMPPDKGHGLRNSLAFYLGVGVNSVYWRNFFQDEATLKDVVTGYGRLGLQGCVGVGGAVFLEPYIDWTGNSFWPVVITIGLNVMVPVSRAPEGGDVKAAVYFGASRSTVADTEMEHDWIATVGFLLEW